MREVGMVGIKIRATAVIPVFFLFCLFFAGCAAGPERSGSAAAKKELEDIKRDRIKPWKEFWGDEL